jgi:hypothetical protein
MLFLLPCPDPGCGAPAEVLYRTVLASTDGPVEHVKVQCLVRHIFLMPAPAHAPAPAPAAGAAGPGESLTGGGRTYG